MRKIIMCPICLTAGNVVECKPVDNSCFKCPECFAEVWPPDYEPKTVIKWIQQTTVEVVNTYRSCSLPEGVRVHGGDKKQGVSNLKAKMGKKTLSVINSSLYDK